MTTSPPSIRDRIAAQKAQASAAQSQAADPLVSAWVGANAGTGKTHVLTQRVLRLLLAGTAPERLLCLTYTNAAAAEMATRVFGELASWVTMAEDGLAARLAALLGRMASAEEQLRARQLFASAIETPGGLKVQTIHAFCERLLQRFPLEAGVAPHFSILDEEGAARIMREATDEVLLRASDNLSSALGRGLMTAVTYASETWFDSVLADVLRGRDWLTAIWTFKPDVEDPWPGIEQLLRTMMRISAATTFASLDTQLVAMVPLAGARKWHGALDAGRTTDRDRAADIQAYIVATTPAERMAACECFLLTGKGEARKSVATKGVASTVPDLDGPQLLGLQARFIALREAWLGLVVVEASLAMLRLADAVMQGYTNAKARRAVLDFEDLIQRTANLLGFGEATDWVLYKLDGGLDHILVDEAQDTSPRQWRIIESLAREFFSGAGSREVAGPRTLFAVGDEKQSIYSFQGARPALFGEMSQKFRVQIEEASLGWRQVPMTLSFRTVAPLLNAVDRIFADAERVPGLTSHAEPADGITHIANRLGQGGLLEIWPTEKPEPGVSADAWSPLEDKVAAAPAVRLAARIARTIGSWLANGERLLSQDRPIRPGDIMILLRRRQPMAAPIIAALKARGIAVAGADRMRLVDQIAVQDLIALGEFVLLPEDDLALAALLKSPLVGLDDVDLLAIAPRRKGTLWSALRAAADDGSTRYGDAVAMLKRWRARADLSPPFEFFAAILDHDGGRARLMKRLGSEAAEALDAFLDEALDHDEADPPSLQGFIGALKASTRQIKRDMEQGRDEVRVLTVHGSKGLEAPIVFLADTCSTRSGGPAGGVVALPRSNLPVGMEAEPLAWAIRGTSRHPTIAAARQTRLTAEAHERNRLLYVALTRARDRLYVGGAEGARGRDKGCWYDQVHDGLTGLLVEAEDTDGKTVLRHACAQTEPPEAHRRAMVDAGVPVPLPDWACRPAPREPMITVPLAPSRLAPLETDDVGDPVERPAPRLPSEPSAPSPRGTGPQDRFLRGTLTHALLEHLPTMPAEAWDRTARAYIERRALALSAAVRASIVREVLGILRHPTLGALFGPQSRAEVPIVAEIRNPSGRGQLLRLSGQIDRLVDLGHEVLIVDYKTNRPAPMEASQVPRAYVLQLAAYRQGLRLVYPGRPIRAAILWTEGARILEIDATSLDQEDARIWSGELTGMDTLS